MKSNDVGYGKPPKHSRFKAGQSGNPNGRPKGSISTAQLIQKHLDAKMTVTIAGQQKTMTRRELLIIGLLNDATKGKDKTRKQVLDLALLLEEKNPPHAHDAMNEVHDDAVINSLLRRYGVKPSMPKQLPLSAKKPIKIKIVKSNLQGKNQ
jgi:hypothetical protein